MDPCLERLQKTIASATSGLEGEALTRRSEGKWSVIEILEHLFLTYKGTRKAFERCFEAGQPQTRKPNLRDRVGAFLVTGLGYLPEGRKSPEAVRPRGLQSSEVVEQIGPAITAMDEAMARCEEKYGSDIAVLDHPILGPLTVHQWRRFHLVHGKHHVKQINALRAKV